VFYVLLSSGGLQDSIQSPSGFLENREIICHFLDLNPASSVVQHVAYSLYCLVPVLHMLVVKVVYN